MTTTTAIKTVGVIGAGRMGLPLIGHMVRNGFAVSAYDIDTTKREAVTKLGGGWAPGPSALARNSDAILVCVGYDRELRELTSSGGLLDDLRHGTIVAVLSTVHPRTAQQLAEDPRLRGPAEVVERLKPVFASFSSDIVLVGGVGAAQVAKAANNLVMWACVIA